MVDHSPLVICHVVNNQGGWGAGFTASLSENLPESEVSYRRWHEGTLRGSGTAVIGDEPDFELGRTLVVQVKPGIYVAHLLAQRGYIGPANPQPLQYPHLDDCLILLDGIVSGVLEPACGQSAVYQMPEIGCGLAGGQWSRVEAYLRDNLSRPVYVVRWAR